MTDAGWQPGIAADVLAMRARLFGIVREFFADRGVLEVDTPALDAFGVTDPHVAAIPVRLHARPGRDFFLQTSPEYAMKRLLAAGAPDIFQVCKVFRDGELGRRHRAEFTMIEWYRRDLRFEAITDETCLLISTLLSAASGVSPPTGVVRHRYADLFEASLGIHPLDASMAELRSRAAAVVPGLTSELERGLGDDRSTWLDLLMGHAVIPALPRDRLAVVHHYPAAQAALARLDPADPRYALRFEVFCGGLELANGYRELTDATEQRDRFARDARRRAAAGMPEMLPDPRLLAAMDHGLPDCCGVAVGFERVMMAATGAERITDVVGFAL